MAFYTYNQNNSGGKFTFDENRGISNFVVVEADSATEADDIASRTGLYFDGCDSGIDCPCCGDRWTKQDNYWSRENTEVPARYYLPLVEVTNEKTGGVEHFIWESKYGMAWMDPKPEGFVHYKNGNVYPVYYKRLEGGYDG